MKRYKAFDSLHKLVQQVDSADAEIGRLEALKTTLSSDRERLVASGRFDDERTVGAASTLQIKLSMLPLKLKQLDDLKANVIGELADGPIRALRNELSDDHGLLIMRGKEDLISAIEPELNRFLGHAPDHVKMFAQQIANASLVVNTLFGLDPIGSQSMGQPIDQARSLLALAGTLERIREAFFTGDTLNLAAVNKKTAFRLAAKEIQQRT
jgi:hypothetical protein